jgi:hypothetical protein
MRNPRYGEDEGKKSADLEKMAFFPPAGGVEVARLA